MLNPSGRNFKGDMLLHYHCGVTGLVILLITMVIALGVLFMLFLYDDEPED